MTRSIRLMALSSLSIFCLAGAVTAAKAQSPTGPAAAVDCTKTRTNQDHATMDHATHVSSLAACRGRTAGALPTSAGQAAFGALSEVVQILEADPDTDWNKVNLEALRMHLVDMNEVTMRSQVTQRSVPGGIEVVVTSDGIAIGAIQRMVPSHSRSMDASPEYHSATTLLENGVRLLVTAKDPTDTTRVTKIRGLGFAGLLTSGEHHARHHLALARGDTAAHSH